MSKINQTVGSILVLAQSEIMDFVGKIATTAKALEANIHQASLSTLVHVEEFGDYRGVSALLNALPKGQRVQALAEWYRNFSDKALSIRLNEGVWQVSLKKGWKQECVFDIEGAAEVSYAEFSKEVAPKPMTVEKLLGMIKRVADQMDDAKAEPSARAVAADLLASHRAKVAAAVTIQ